MHIEVVTINLLIFGALMSHALIIIKVKIPLYLISPFQKLYYRTLNSQHSSMILYNLC